MIVNIESQRNQLENQQENLTNQLSSKIQEIHELQSKIEENDEINSSLLKNLNSTKEIILLKESEILSLNGEKLESILDYQKSINADIITMGAYSHNRFKSAIFGSFTTNMILKSKVPLLLFR